jgi:hypothetical protein
MKDFRLGSATIQEYRRFVMLCFSFGVLIIMTFSAFTCGDGDDATLNDGDEDLHSDNDDSDEDDDTTSDDGNAVAQINTCFIDGVQYRALQTNPANVCLICDVKKTQTEWTQNNAAPCDDGLFCNSRDLCYYGECSIHEGDPCSPMDCNEDLNACVEVTY